MVLAPRKPPEFLGAHHEPAKALVLTMLLISSIE